LGLLESRIALMIWDLNQDKEFAEILTKNWSYTPQKDNK
jgi:hypothetical protein